MKNIPPIANDALGEVCPVVPTSITWAPLVTRPFASVVTTEYVPAFPTDASVTEIDLSAEPSKEALPVASPVREIVLAVANFVALVAFPTVVVPFLIFVISVSCEVFFDWILLTLVSNVLIFVVCPDTVLDNVLTVLIVA